MQTIVSLLPAATEICFNLELGARVVGVSHECDHPAEARTRPVLTRAAMAGDGGGGASPAASQQAGALRGLALHDVDQAMLAQVAPDVILTQLTQDSSAASAVSLAEVKRAVAGVLGKPVEVVSLAPRRFPEVLDGIRRLGRAVGAQAAATALMGAMRDRLDIVRRRTESLQHARTLVLERLDPPMVAGCWTPTLIRTAGGEPVLAREGLPATATTWEAIAAADPEVVLIVPRGLRVAQTMAALPALYANPLFACLRAVQGGRVVVIDGNAYFNRPGPRLVDSAHLAAVAIHPSVFGTDHSAADLLRVERAP